jgi:hypothetical protein
MHMTRFVVFQVEDEWVVTYGDQSQLSFATRMDAEHSAFDAADALAANGYAVSVLIMPNLPGAFESMGRNAHILAAEQGPASCRSRMGADL